MTDYKILGGLHKRKRKLFFYLRSVVIISNYELVNSNCELLLAEQSTVIYLIKVILNLDNEEKIVVSRIPVFSSVIGLAHLTVIKVLLQKPII